jgi:hypothetical protein
MSDKIGRLTGSFRELHAMGCIQTGADVHPEADDAIKQFHVLFYGLMEATGDNPCPGCPAFNNGLCAAYKRYHTGLHRVIEPGRHGQPSFRPRCKCGFKIRGAHHSEGSHHKSRARST